ncbi:TFIIH subunit TTDA/Tfb5 [Globomyces pollinis-pini]|nr:TFIIH subunit TTDA/Tfb5 [Globomyces pollinis-pini]
MVKAIKGVLLECDQAVKTIILDLDTTMKFIFEDLDDTHLFIDAAKVGQVQDRLEEILEVFC